MKKFFKRITLLMAGLFFLQLIFILTGTPYNLAKWLAGRGLGLVDDPEHIVVLGGGGIPSSSGLIRTYYAASFIERYPWARYIMSLPADKNPWASSVGRMRDELVMRGVSPEQIALEYQGRNTWEQAVEVRKLFKDDQLDEPVMIVSSPEHLRRSILCFKKAGFKNVGGQPAYSLPAEADLGSGSRWRYGIWQTWGDQPKLLRELTALAVYWCKGRI